ncbi:MAG: 2-dehydropantoate 2-reductase [Burkholderiales bacterium]|nr:2-dehydropantoate 2-reductase [Burkholderiales bacterium]
MRTLILGAGATGGYFGARLIEAGADVTFLVRERRAAQLQQDGLLLSSPHGDVRARARFIVRADAADVYDLILLSCKAYDLRGAIDAIAPAVGADSLLLPLLNGMAHYRALDTRFGEDRVLGGLCHLAVTLAPSGEVRHLNRLHSITFGERSGGQSARCDAVHAVLAPIKAEVNYSHDVLLDAWDKWVFLATLAGMNCLMRGTVGDIVSTPEGRSLTQAMLAECAEVASRSGHALPAERLQKARALLTQEGSSFAASMLRDIERGGPTEGEHILGDLVERAAPLGVAVPLLRIARTHVQVHEARRLKNPGVQA